MNTANFLTMPAMMFPDQEILVDGADRFSYDALARRVRGLGAALRANGAGLDRPVAVLATNSHRYVAAYYGAAAAGATFVPLNYRAKLHELEHMIGKASPAVLFFEERYRDTLAQLSSALPEDLILVPLSNPKEGELSFDELLASGDADAPEIDVEESDTAILMYTSGTTSLPKGVMLTHGDFTAYVVGNVEMADGSPSGTALLCVPLYHIAGATNIMSSVWAGRKIVLLPQFDAGAWLAAVAREKVTHAFVVPTMMKKLLDHPDFHTTDLSSLENLSYGGAPMPFSVIRRAIEAFPPACGFVNAFGQTETTSTLTILGPEDHRLVGDGDADEIVLKRLRSIGRPLPDVEIRIADETGVALSDGETGEILVRTPRIMKGYAGGVSGGAEVDADGYLHTRDLGYIDPDGYVFLAGRKDDMIIRGGENIAPAEVEACLQAHRAIEEIAVFGIPSEEWGQIVAAAVVLKPGATATADELMTYCQARLASFKKPEALRFLPELPRNPLGKILRKDLQSAFGAGQA